MHRFNNNSNRDRSKLTMPGKATRMREKKRKCRKRLSSERSQHFTTMKSAVHRKRGIQWPAAPSSGRSPSPSRASRGGDFGDGHSAAAARSRACSSRRAQAMRWRLRRPASTPSSRTSLRCLDSFVDCAQDPNL